MDTVNQREPLQQNLSQIDVNKKITNPNNSINNKLPIFIVIIVIVLVVILSLVYYLKILNTNNVIQSTKQSSKITTEIPEAAFYPSPFTFPTLSFKRNPPKCESPEDITKYSLKFAYKRALNDKESLYFYTHDKTANFSVYLFKENNCGYRLENGLLSHGDSGYKEPIKILQYQVTLHTPTIIKFSYEDKVLDKYIKRGISFYDLEKDLEILNIEVFENKRIIFSPNPNFVTPGTFPSYSIEPKIDYIPDGICTEFNNNKNGTPVTSVIKDFSSSKKEVSNPKEEIKNLNILKQPIRINTTDLDCYATKINSINTNHELTEVVVTYENIGKLVINLKPIYYNHFPIITLDK